MAIQLSIVARNARLDSIETTAGASAVMQLLTGSPPANCAAATTGTVIATIALPADWMAAAASGSKSLSGTWQDLSADASGVVGYFRVSDSTVTTCHIQGTVSMTGGGGDMIIQNTNAATGQPVSITSFTLTDGNS